LKLSFPKGGPHIGENLANVMNDQPEDEDTKSPVASSEDESFIDPYEPVVTKIKSFDLSKPISVKEAIFALDYIDHDFYVFRDEETNEISVVYKRNAGGVGLIQPSQN
jgi:putative sigma-54 modulation protein